MIANAVRAYARVVGINVQGGRHEVIEEDSG